MKKINLDKLQYSKSQDIVGGTANLPTPAQPPVTLGAQPSPSASVPPPPPLPQSSPLLPPSSGLKSRLPAVNDHKALLLESIRNTSGRPLKKYSGEFTSKGPINNIDRQPQGFTDELKIRFKSSGNNTEQESRKDFAKRIEMDLEKRKKEKVLKAKKKLLSSIIRCCKQKIYSLLILIAVQAGLQMKVSRKKQSRKKETDKT